MSKKHKSIITHDDTEPVVLLRRDYMYVCEGNQCAAAILSQLEYWSTVKRKRGKCITVYKTQEELQEELYYMWGLNAIGNALTYLVNNNLITRSQPKKYRYDRTYYYELNIEKVQAEINLKTRYLKSKDSMLYNQRLDALNLKTRSFNNKDTSITEITTENTTENTNIVFSGKKQKTESYNESSEEDSFSNIFNKESYVSSSLINISPPILNNITFPEIVTQLLDIIPGNSNNNIRTMNKHINNYGLDAVMDVAKVICDKYTVGALSSANWQYITNALKETRQSYVDNDGIYHCRCGLQHEIINIDYDVIRCGCGDEIDVDHVLSFFRDVDDADDVFDEIQHIKNFQ